MLPEQADDHAPLHLDLQTRYSEHVGKSRARISPPFIPLDMVKMIGEAHGIGRL